MFKVDLLYVRVLLLLVFVSTCYFFYNVSATTEIYPSCHTLSLHDALPIFQLRLQPVELLRPHALQLLRIEGGVADIVGEQRERRTQIGRQREQADRKSTRLNSSH